VGRGGPADPVRTAPDLFVTTNYKFHPTLGPDVMSTSMNDLMRQDESVDALPDRRVKQVLIIDSIWRIVRDELQARYGPNAFMCDPYDEFERVVTEESFDAFCAYLDDQQFVAGDAVETLVTRESDAVDDVFGMFYGDTDVREARDAIKRTLAGCMGMPRDRMIRDNLDRWADD